MPPHDAAEVEQVAEELGETPPPLSKSQQRTRRDKATRLWKLCSSAVTTLAHAVPVAALANLHRALSEGDDGDDDDDRATVSAPSRAAMVDATVKLLVKLLVEERPESLFAPSDREVAKLLGQVDTLEEELAALMMDSKGQEVLRLRRQEAAAVVAGGALQREVALKEREIFLLKAKLNAIKRYMGDDAYYKVVQEAEEEDDDDGEDDDEKEEDQDNGGAGGSGGAGRGEGDESNESVGGGESEGESEGEGEGEWEGEGGGEVEGGDISEGEEDYAS